MENAWRRENFHSISNLWSVVYAEEIQWLSGKILSESVFWEHGGIHGLDGVIFGLLRQEKGVRDLWWRGNC